MFEKKFNVLATLQGFEPRGTVLSERAAAWENLLKTTRWNGPLTFYPGSIVTDITNETLEAAQWHKQSASEKNITSSSDDFDDPLGPSLEFETDERAYGGLNEDEDDDVSGRIVFERPHFVKPNKIVGIGRKNFFCNNPSKLYRYNFYLLTFI